MELFCTDGEWVHCRDREKRCSLVFRALACAAPAVFILLCFFVRTSNARTMHLVMLAVPGILGCAAIAVYVLLARPARQELNHLEMLRSGEKTELEGILQVTRDSFRIPKSVRVRRVILDTGAERPVLLNVDERWAGRMPPDSTRVRIAAVHSYIAGVDPAGAKSGRPPENRKTSRVRTFFRGVSAVTPLLVLWAFFVLIFGSFIFYQITDTSPAHKITVFVDTAVVNENQLAARLEEGLPDPIRMVKVRPFTYMMFGDEELKTADLYIVPDSRAAQYAEWFAPGEESVPVFDPEAGLSVAGECIVYVPDGTAAEAYRLYLGASSAHLEDGLARRAAELLISIGTEKEETP